MAKKTAKRGKTRSKKARKKAAKKSARKTAKILRRKPIKARRKAAKKAARKTVRKAVRRPKAAKKAAKKPAKKAVRRPKAAKKAAKTKRRAKPPAKVAKPVGRAAAPGKSEPRRGIDARDQVKQPAKPIPQPKPTIPPKPTPQPEPKPQDTFVTGHFNPNVERYYSMLAQNTPESHRLGTLQLDKILAGNPKDIVALAEKGHDLVNNWRNDVLSPDAVKECRGEFATGDLFTCALKWAQRSIDAANAQGISSPYGYWARAYAYKYQRQPKLSSDDYRTALSFSGKAFLNHIGRRKKDLVAEVIEGMIYWAKVDQLQKLIDKIDSEVPPAPGKLESWINWVKCFALHLQGKFDASNALYPDYLPDDRDVNLIIAANYARQGKEDMRQLHRKLFLEKAGNATWSATKEIERSPFVDKTMGDFWFESVSRALRASSAAPSAEPAPSI